MSKYPNTRGGARRHELKTVRVATHSAVLRACLAATPGDVDVLEHGMGVGSTPLIHAFSRLRKMLSYETEPQWMTCSTCSDEEAKKKHVISNPKPEQFEEEAKRTFGSLDQCVVFVDGPGKERFEVVRLAMTSGAPYIIEHDAECYSVEEVQARKEISARCGYSAHQYVLENPETAFYVKAGAKMPELPASSFVAL